MRIFNIKTEIKGRAFVQTPDCPYRSSSYIVYADREIKRHPLQPPRPSHVANKDCCQTGPASHIASPLFNLLNSCQCSKVYSL